MLSTISESRIHGTWIYFEKSTSIYKRTDCWMCRTKGRDTPLGHIKWYAPWRCYCFYPAELTVFNALCLTEIGEFLTRLTCRHKEKGN